MNEAATAMRFDERIGGVLVAPRRTFARLAAGEARAGDVPWLLVAKLVIDELPQLVRAARAHVAVGPGYALTLVLASLNDLVLDVFGILAAGLVFGLFGRRGQGGAKAGALDLAAYAWIPYFAVGVAAALVFTALGHPPTATARHLVDGVALAWAVAAWAIALVAARRAAGAS